MADKMICRICNAGDALMAEQTCVLDADHWPVAESVLYAEMADQKARYEAMTRFVVAGLAYKHAVLVDGEPDFDAAASQTAMTAGKNLLVAAMCLDSESLTMIESR